MNCPSCNHIVEGHGLFCNKCGSKLGRGHVEDDTSLVSCDKCNFMFYDNLKACPDCGDPYNKCPGCDADNDVSSVNCRKCNIKLPEVCSKCGENLPDDEELQFCGTCGTPRELDDNSIFEDTIVDIGLINEINDEKTIGPTGAGEFARNVGFDSDRYSVIEKIGAGGMGTVYKAKDSKLDRVVAIKKMLMLLPDNDQATKRFITEATSIAHLNHPNIVQVYDRGEDDTGVFIVMEYVKGCDLSSVIKEKGKLGKKEALKIFKGICDGTSHAHEKGVIHRDIKPANILLEEGNIPKLVDFGLARIEADTHNTGSNIGMGTLAYAAPEQMEDASSVNHCADIYALGKTLYFMLTAMSPDAIDLDELPEDFRSAVAKSLKPRPEDRHSSVDEFYKSLEMGAVAGSFISDPSWFKCEKCKTPNRPSAEHCSNCGKHLFTECLNCGENTREGIKCCEKCGTNIVAFREYSSLFDEAKSLLLDKNYFGAVKSANLALGKIPGQLEAEELIIKAQQLENEFQKNINSATELVKEYKYDSAEKRLIRVLELKPGYQPARELMLEVYSGQMDECHKSGDSGAVMDLASMILRADPENEKAKQYRDRWKTSLVQLEEAQKLFNRKEYDLALELANQVSKTIPGFSESAELVSKINKIINQFNLHKNNAEDYFKNKQYEKARNSICSAEGLTSDKEKMAFAKPIMTEIDDYALVAKALCEKAVELAKKGKETTLDICLQDADNIYPDYPGIIGSKKAIAQALEDNTVKRAEDMARSINYSSVIAGVVLVFLSLMMEGIKGINLVIASGLYAWLVLDNTKWIFNCGKSLFTGFSPFLYGVGITLVVWGTGDFDLSRGDGEGAIAFKYAIIAIIACYIGLANWNFVKKRKGIITSVCAYCFALPFWYLLLHQSSKNASYGLILNLCIGLPAIYWVFIAIAKNKIMIPHSNKKSQNLIRIIGLILFISTILVAIISPIVEGEYLVGKVNGYLDRGRIYPAHKFVCKMPIIEHKNSAIEKYTKLYSKYSQNRQKVVDRFNKVVVERSELMLEKGDFVGAERIISQMYQKNVTSNANSQILPSEGTYEVIDVESIASEDEALSTTMAKIQKVSKAAEKEKIVYKLVKDIKADIKAKRLSKPAKDCAISKINKLKTIDSENENIGVLSKEVSDTYVDLALGAKRKRQYTKALGYLELSYNVYPTGQTKSLIKDINYMIGMSKYKSETGAMHFKLIPSGSFTMGSPNSEMHRDKDEKQYRVKVTAEFLMSSTEITVGQFSKFVNDQGYTTQAENGSGTRIWNGKKWEYKPDIYWRNPGYVQSVKNPVTCISWFDAIEYCNWLSKKDGLSPAYIISGDKVTWDKASKGYRLPTEAEWEYACRAGTSTPFYNGNKYKLSESGWYWDNSSKKSHQVAGKARNIWGLYDMHGNAAEWCWDWKGDYLSATVSDPDGVASGEKKVVRGGAWIYGSRNCRAADRSSSKPDGASQEKGFRIVRSI
jgi:serine/threonine protein kinase/formylglycine-generating enzyme required for sulfatase activity